MVLSGFEAMVVPWVYAAVSMIFSGDVKRALDAHLGSPGVAKASTEYGFLDVHVSGEFSGLIQTIVHMAAFDLLVTLSICIVTYLMPTPTSTG